MKVTTDYFVNSFHALNGVTIGERRKNLFKLLNNIQRNEHSEVDFNALQPATHLEAVFKVEVMLYFRKISELLDVLKSENPILIDKVLKSKKWFWNDAFKNISGQQFVDDILGRISFNTKIQLLNKLAMYLENHQKGNEYYEAVKHKYGLHLAAKLLPCCTTDFILLFIEKDNVKLMESKLLIIIKKHPNIIEAILSILKNIRVAVSVEYDNVFKYIAHTNIRLYLKLRETYKLRLRLGRRCTRKFVDTNKDEVANNATDFCTIFHWQQMVRSLKTKFTTFYKNMFPKSIDDCSRHYFNSSLLQIIKYLRQPDVNILLTTFKDLYGKDLWECPDLVLLEFFEMLPPEQRESKLQRKYKPSYISDDKWMCYYSTKVSVPYLKERISLSSDISSRAELVGLLVETCKINKDKLALSQICQFIVNRHRNDNVSVRSSFLRNVQIAFKLEDLDEAHWTPINELLKIFVLNDESFYNAGEFLQNYILFRLKQNLPVTQLLIEYFNSKPNNWNLFTNYPRYEKLCLLEFSKILSELYKGYDLDHQNVSYISALISYNKRHIHDQISIFLYPNCIESVKTVLKETRRSHDTTFIVSYCAHLKDNTKECNQLVNYFLSICQSCDLDILIYLIRKNPEIVQNHVDKVTSVILKQYTSTVFIHFWKYSKYYEHLGIPQNIIKICLNRIKEDSQESGRVYEKNLAVHALSCLMLSREYLSIVALHYPRELKADAETQSGQKAYELQEYIAKSLKYLTPPSDSLESILFFCKGDYLKLIQGSLYSVCCNTNEDKLQPFFAELIGRAVSIRKHALHLTFHVLDKAEIFSILDKFMKTEKNASIRKFIFKHTFNFFAKNRDDYSWELVKLNILAVDVNDQEAFEILLQHDKIPKDYLDRYLTFTWEFLEKLPDPDGNIEVKKTTLLNSIKAEIIPVLGSDFCEPILEKYFFKFKNFDKETRFQLSIQSFACKYIIYGEHTYVHSITTSLNNFIKISWYNRDTEGFGRSCIREFIEKLCAEFHGNDDALPHSEVLTDFCNIWNELLKPHEAFIEYLLLTLTMLYLQKLPVNETVTELAGLCNTLVDTYGIAIIGLISGHINTYINYLLGSYEQEDIYMLIDNLVEKHSSVACMLVAIRLLDSNKVVNKTKEKYEKIIQILRATNEPLIQIFLQSHFTNSADFF